MKESDVRPGMFISDVLKTISDPILLYIVADVPDEESYLAVDLHRSNLTYLRYLAINDDYEEFEGDLDNARMKTIKVVFE